MNLSVRLEAYELTGPKLCRVAPSLPLVNARGVGVLSKYIVVEQRF